MERMGGDSWGSSFCCRAGATRAAGGGGKSVGPGGVAWVTAMTIWAVSILRPEALAFDGIAFGIMVSFR